MGWVRSVESSWASMVLISRFKYFKELSCLSLSSLVYSCAIVEVLKSIKSRVVSGQQSLCESMVSEIIFLTLSLKLGWVYKEFFTLE